MTALGQMQGPSLLRPWPWSGVNVLNADEDEDEDGAESDDEEPMLTQMQAL